MGLDLGVHKLSPGSMLSLTEAFDIEVPERLAARFSGSANALIPYLRSGLERLT